jgi:hypothetical protein
MTETVNLAAIAEKERKDVESLINLNIRLSYEGNHIKQSISNMLFQSLLQYSNRKNYESFWEEIENVFKSIQTYDALYDNWIFKYIYECLKTLGRFPALEENANLRVKKMQEAAIKYENERKQYQGGVICIGTSSYATPPKNIVVEPVAVKKTTRSGKSY